MLFNNMQHGYIDDKQHCDHVALLPVMKPLLTWEDVSEPNYATLEACVYFKGKENTLNVWGKTPSVYLGSLKYAAKFLVLSYFSSSSVCQETRFPSGVFVWQAWFLSLTWCKASSGKWTLNFICLSAGLMTMHLKTHSIL